MREADLADAEILDIFERFYLGVEKQLAKSWSKTNIDTELLNKQKACLVSLISEGDLGLPEECELIEGVLRLLEEFELRGLK